MKGLVNLFGVMREASYRPLELWMELGVATQADVSAGQIPTGVHVNGPLFANLVYSIHLSPSCVAQVIRESQGSYLVVGTNRGNISSLALFLRDVELNLWKRAQLLDRGLVSTEFDR